MVPEFARDILNYIHVHRILPAAFDHLNPTPKSYTDVLFILTLSAFPPEVPSVDNSKVNADIVTKELSLILPKSIDPSAFTPLLRQFNQYKDEVGQFLLREPVRNLVMDLLANPAVSKNVLRWLLKFMRDDCQYWHVKYPSYPSIDSSDSARHKTWKTLLNMCRKLIHTVGRDDLELYRLLEVVLYDLEVSQSEKDDIVLEEDVTPLQIVQLCSPLLDSLINNPSQYRQIAVDIAMILGPKPLKSRSIAVMFQLYFAGFHDQTDLLLSQLCDMGAISSEAYAMCRMPSLLQHVLFDAIPLALVRCLENEAESITSFLCGNEEQQEHLDILDFDLPNTIHPALDILASATNTDRSETFIELSRITCDAPARFLPCLTLAARAFVELEERKEKVVDGDRSLEEHPSNPATTQVFLNMWSSFLAWALDTSNPLSPKTPSYHNRLPQAVALFLLTFPASSIYLWTSRPSSTHLATPLTDFVGAILASYRCHLNRSCTRSGVDAGDRDGGEARQLVRAAIDWLAVRVPVKVMIQEAKTLAKVVEIWGDDEEEGVVEVLRARVANIGRMLDMGD